VKGPRAAFAHLRELLGKHGPYDAGHNAMGGAMVVVLILAVLAQAGTGLFSADTDTALISGPLAGKVGEAVIEKATIFHHFWINVLLVLAALHVVAVLTYLVWKRHNLVGAMLTGQKPVEDVVPPGKPAPALAFASGRLAISLLIASAAIVYFIVRVGG
jgi:cytochrome b